MESFWSTLKTELVHQTTFHNLQETKLAIFGYIELFCKPTFYLQNLNSCESAMDSFSKRLVRLTY